MLENLKKLILEKKESEMLDIKRQFYEKATKMNFIKDVVAFANNITSADKYIVFGVDEENWTVCGINKIDVKDISSIEQLLNSYVEPKLKIKLDFIEIQNKELLVLTICKENTDRPYIIKKDGVNDKNKLIIHQGTIYIRHGATNSIADRNDLDTIYRIKQGINYSLVRSKKDNSLTTTFGIKHFISFEVKIDNYSNKTYEIFSSWLRISVNENTFIIKGCICSIGDLSTKDKYLLDKNHLEYVLENSYIVRWFNFPLNENIINQIKGQKLKLEVVFNSGQEEKTLEVDYREK